MIRLLEFVLINHRIDLVLPSPDRSPAGKAPLDWNTRMNIAARVAKGLEYLHHKGVVYRRFMSSSDILLGDGYHPKLSQYGLAALDRLVAEDEEELCIDFTRTATIAPETAFTRKATMESNVYSFGGAGVDHRKEARRTRPGHR